jgi:hypothetical protein
MGSSPLFNPYSPAGRSTTLDHFDLFAEPVDETPMPAESAPPEEAGDPQALTKGE